VVKIIASLYKRTNCVNKKKIILSFIHFFRITVIMSFETEFGLSVYPFGKVSILFFSQKQYINLWIANFKNSYGQCWRCCLGFSEFFSFRYFYNYSYIYNNYNSQDHDCNQSSTNTTTTCTVDSGYTEPPVLRIFVRYNQSSL